MSLRRQLRDHYGNKSLSATKLEELAALPAPRGRRRWLTLIAASVALAAGALLLIPTGPDRALAVVEEIALNHTKDLAAEYVAASYAEVDRQMQKLDFRAVEPRRLRNAGFTLTGARYCSLQGCIAAQVKLTDAAGRKHTLYEVRDGAAFRGIDEAEHRRGGLRIRLWREGDLLLGLAGPATEDRGAPGRPRR